MSVQAIAWALRQRCGSPSRKVVLITLANYADESDSCYPSVERLAEETEISVRTVQAAINELIEMGLVDRISRDQQTNRYQLNLSVTATQGPPTTPPAQTARPIQTAQKVPEPNGPSQTFAAAERRIVESYNAMASKCGFTTVKLPLNEKRRTHIRCRISDRSEEDVLLAIRKMGESSFLRGDNGQGWRADFDFLLAPSKFDRILEGVYDDTRRQAAPRRADPRPFHPGIG